MPLTLDELRAMYGDLVLESVMPLAKDFKEAVVMRKPVALYKPRSQAAKAVAALGEELLARAADSRIFKEVA